MFQFFVGLAPYITRFIPISLLPIVLSSLEIQEHREILITYPSEHTPAILKASRQVFCLGVNEQLYSRPVQLSCSQLLRSTHRSFLSTLPTRFPQNELHELAKGCR